MQDLGLFALRLAIGLVFAYHGWGKLGDMASTTAFFGSAGIPFAGLFAWIVGLTEFFGGLALILGVYPRAAAKLLGIVMVVALLVVHTGGTWQMAELPIVALGGCLAILGAGAGNWVLSKKDCSCNMCTPKA